MSLDELIKTLREMERNGIIDLDERIDIRNNRKLERVVKKVETDINRKLLDELWIWN